MKFFLLVIFIFMVGVATGQTNQSTEQIRQQMAKIRQTTNWDDPAAAQKANEEIKKLAKQLNGGQAPANSSTNPQVNDKPVSITSKTSDASSENVVAIAERFLQRSYKKLDAISKSQFDQDYKKAESEKFSLSSIRRLSTSGALLITFGNDHNLACVYLASAVKAIPSDTLSVNNFGGYLRIIDSTKTSLPVLLYANKLFSQSPVILTQIGCSYFELNDQKKSELYLKEALKWSPEFGQAHTALCELYIKQGRLQDAIIELFAGVKGMAGSYNRASGNFAYLQQKAEKSDTKEDFWEETRKQVNPKDALAPLVPQDNKLKMPGFPNCLKVEDWMEGGGYGSAAQSYSRFHSHLMKFVSEFQRVQKEVPDLPPNAVLRDYPSERFALDCINEYFFQQSKKEADDFEDKLDEIMQKVNAESESYLEIKESYTNDYLRCCEGCGTDQYCIEECHRVYCTKECPAANIYNKKLQGYYEDYLAQFKITVDNQTEILDDLYAFSEQWFSKIQSPYWSKIYAYEIQRVALTVMGNAYMAYPRAFPFTAHNNCGTDCSLYANPYPIPAEEVENKDPKENNCPKDSKFSLSLAMCSMDFECESFEFGCSAVVAFSIKRNFENKSTTSFIGVGAEGGFAGLKGEAKAGFTFTKYDNGDTDTGFKGELSATVGSGVRSGKNYEFTATVMEGVRTDSKNIYAVGL